MGTNTSEKSRTRGPNYWVSGPRLFGSVLTTGYLELIPTLDPQIQEISDIILYLYYLNIFTKSCLNIFHSVFFLLGYPQVRGCPLPVFDDAIWDIGFDIIVYSLL